MFLDSQHSCNLTCAVSAVGGTCKNGDAIKASAVDGLCSKCNKGYILNKKGTCDKDVCSEGLSSTFWPTKTKTPSKLGVVLHTHKPNHIAYRIPASMFSTLPKGWFAKDKQVHFYCNDNCKDSGSPGGCTARDGGILTWPDDMKEDKSFRKCLLESVAKQGGVWKKDTFCGACVLVLAPKITLSYGFSQLTELIALVMLVPFPQLGAEVARMVR